MLRVLLLLTLLAPAASGALADDIETVKSWDHYRELMITDGNSPAEADARVTFLLDKAGVIQYVHPGMEYHEADGSEEHAMCANDMVGIRAAIERLLAEQRQARPT